MGIFVLLNCWFMFIEFFPAFWAFWPQRKLKNLFMTEREKLSDSVWFAL